MKVGSKNSIRFDQPALGIVVLGWAGDDGKIPISITMGIQETTILQLLDGELIVTKISEDPFLGIVILRYPSDNRRIIA